MQTLTEELENCIYQKSDETVAERYRDKVYHSKKNIQHLTYLPECTTLFLNKKIDIKKIKTKHEKFKKSCQKLEDKMKKSKGA